MGVSIKNIGTYMKSAMTTSTNPESTLKSFNSLNIKPSSGYKSNFSSPVSTTTATGTANANANNQTTDSASKPRQASNLVHRHSNPISSYSTSSNPNSAMSMTVSNAAKSRALQQTPNSLNDSAALPRIRINT